MRFFDWMEDFFPAATLTAVLLLAFTLLYNVGEGMVAVVSGLRAGSLTLLAFGADSYLEVAAAGAVLWRLHYRDEEAGERAERNAIRLIGWTFLVLAAAVTFQAAIVLAGGEGARESTTGAVVLIASVTLMPLLAFWKLRVAAATGLGALAAEARETIACSYLSFTALVGILAVSFAGWWWIDGVTSLLLVPWLVREGIEGVRGEASYEGESPCSCRACLFGLRPCGPEPTCCSPACC